MRASVEAGPRECYVLGIGTSGNEPYHVLEPVLVDVVRDHRMSTLYEDAQVTQISRSSNCSKSPLASCNIHNIALVGLAGGKQPARILQLIIRKTATAIPS